MINNSGNSNITGILKKDLFDTNASIYVLSCMMHNPLLVTDDRYPLQSDDFYNQLPTMIYGAIVNLANSGTTKISPQDVDLYLKQYGSQYAYYTKENGYEFVNQCYKTTEGSDLKQFDYYYKRVKKFAVLRSLEKMGINTDKFYDVNNILNRDQEDEKINKLTIQDIFSSLNEQLTRIQDINIGKNLGMSKDASNGMRDLVKELQDCPEVGLPLEGDIINFTCRGARMGKLYTYSAPSGSGKTRYMVENACAISLPYIDNEGKIIIRGTKENPDYQKVLFVTTEQQPDEIQTMILAHVSGVNEKSIVLGNYTTDEYDRISKALDIIDKFGNNFIIEVMPDPSIASVKARLIKYIVQQKVEYIFYDYIFSSPGLLSEFRDVAVREDVALMMLSNTLKEIAATYNIFIQSATQLNDGWTKKEIGLRDQNCLRGSKAIADKIDIGLIGVRITQEEWKQVEAIWGELKIQHPNKYLHDPNIVIDVYKNRRGEMNCVKVFRYFNYATCRCEDLFVTDANYKSIKDMGQLQYEENAYDFLDLKAKGSSIK